MYQVNNIKLFVLDDVWYTHTVNKWIYADSPESATKVIEVILGMPPALQTKILTELKENRLVIFAENSVLLSRADALGEYSVFSEDSCLIDRLFPQQPNSEKFRGGRIRLAIGKASNAYIESLLTHEFTHHLWIYSNFKLAQQHGHNILQDTVFSWAHGECCDPFYFADLRKGTERIPRHLLTCYFEELGTFLSEYNLDSPVNILSKTKASPLQEPAYLLFKWPLIRFEYALMERLTEFVSDPSLHPSYKNFSKIIYQNFLQATDPLNFITSCLYHHLQKEILLRDLRYCIATAASEFRAELAAYVSQVRLRAPLFLRTHAPRTAALLASAQQATLHTYPKHPRFEYKALANRYEAAPLMAKKFLIDQLENTNAITMRSPYTFGRRLPWHQRINPIYPRTLLRSLYPSIALLSGYLQYQQAACTHPDYKPASNISAVVTNMALDLLQYSLIVARSSNAVALTLTLGAELFAYASRRMDNVDLESVKNNRDLWCAYVFSLDLSPTLENDFIAAFDRGESWTRERNGNFLETTNFILSPFRALDDAKSATANYVRDEINNVLADEPSFSYQPEESQMDVTFYPLENQSLSIFQSEKTRPEPSFTTLCAIKNISITDVNVGKNQYGASLISTSIAASLLSGATISFNLNLTGSAVSSMAVGFTVPITETGFASALLSGAAMSGAAALAMFAGFHFYNKAKKRQVKKIKRGLSNTNATVDSINQNLMTLQTVINTQQQLNDTLFIANQQSKAVNGLIHAMQSRKKYANKKKQKAVARHYQENMTKFKRVGQELDQLINDCEQMLALMENDQTEHSQLFSQPDVDKQSSITNLMIDNQNYQIITNELMQIALTHAERFGTPNQKYFMKAIDCLYRLSPSLPSYVSQAIFGYQRSNLPLISAIITADYRRQLNCFNITDSTLTLERVMTVVNTLFNTANLVNHTIPFDNQHLQATGTILNYCNQAAVGYQVVSALHAGTGIQAFHHYLIDKSQDWLTTLLNQASEGNQSTSMLYYQLPAIATLSAAYLLNTNNYFIAAKAMSYAYSLVTGQYEETACKAAIKNLLHWRANYQAATDDSTKATYLNNLITSITAAKVACDAIFDYEQVNFMLLPESYQFVKQASIVILENDLFAMYEQKNYSDFISNSYFFLHSSNQYTIKPSDTPIQYLFGTIILRLQIYLLDDKNIQQDAERFIREYNALYGYFTKNKSTFNEAQINAYAHYFEQVATAFQDKCLQFIYQHLLSPSTCTQAFLQVATNFLTKQKAYPSMHNAHGLFSKVPTENPICNGVRPDLLTYFT